MESREPSEKTSAFFPPEIPTSSDYMRPSLMCTKSDSEKTYRSLQEELGSGWPPAFSMDEGAESELQIFDGDRSLKDAIQKHRRQSDRDRKSGPHQSPQAHQRLSDCGGKRMSRSGPSAERRPSHARISRVDTAALEKEVKHSRKSDPKDEHASHARKRSIDKGAGAGLEDDFPTPRRPSIPLIAPPKQAPRVDPTLAMTTRDSVRPATVPSDDRSPAAMRFSKNVVKLMNAKLLLGEHKEANDKVEKKHKRMPKKLTPRQRVEVLELLTSLPVFATCCANFLNHLARTVEELAIAKGEEITPEQIVDPHMIVVTRGSLQMKIQGQEVMRIGAGEYFGETVLLGFEEAWCASLQAEGMTVIQKIYREDFVEALQLFSDERAHFTNVLYKYRDYVKDGTLINPCVVFRGLRDSSISAMDAGVVLRMFFPGQRLLEEGKPGNEFYILVRGQATVEIAGRVVRHERRDSSTEDQSPRKLAPRRSVFIPERPSADEESPASIPVCFGELGLLGKDVRTASVVAQSMCLVRVVYRPIFLSVMAQHGESIKMDEITKLLEQRSLSGVKTKPPAQLLQEVEIFKQVGCSNEFLDFLAQHLEDRVFLADQKIIDEATDDRCMYLLGEGNARVVKDGAEVATLSGGAVFGEIIVLGLATKRTASVIASETCYMQVLHQSVVVKGLELFPEERRKVLMMAFSNSGTSDSGSEDPAAKKRPSSASMTHRAFLKALKQSSLFASIDPGFVEELSTVSQDRIYMPGDLIIEEGKRGDSMFIMVSGQATVFVSDPDAVEVAQKEESQQTGDPKKTKMLSRIGVLTAGSISGELAMLGVALIRSATIEAQTICSMWEITQEKALAILERFPDAQNHFANLIVEHLERTVPARILSTALFRSFDRKFRMLISLYCDRRAYFPGQKIAREGQPGDRLYIVNQGRATLEKKGVTVKTYAAGSYFGSTVMLGIHKVYLGTLSALQTCHMLMVARTSYQQALEQYPSHAAANELKRVEKVSAEELREAIQRISTRKLIWKRYQLQLMEAQNPEDQMTSQELLERAWQVWRERVTIIVRQRRQRETERAQYKQMMEQWVQKRRDAQEKIKQKAESNDQTSRPNTVSEPLARRRELVKVLENWPTPRPSPHYRLRVFNVLHEAAVKRPATGAPLLPLLRAPQPRNKNLRPPKTNKIMDGDLHVSFATPADKVRLPSPCPGIESRCSDREGERWRHQDGGPSSLDIDFSAAARPRFQSPSLENGRIEPARKDDHFERQITPRSDGSDDDCGCVVSTVSLRTHGMAGEMTGDEDDCNTPARLESCPGFALQAPFTTNSGNKLNSLVLPKLDDALLATST